MRRDYSLRVVSIAVFSLFAVRVPLGWTAEKPPFYQGKTINIIINFAAGGPTDIESRIFAKHLSRHIPGQPTVTVQAMGGGGGLIAVNYIGEVAKPDGLNRRLFHRQPVPASDQRSRVAGRYRQSSASSPECMESPFLTSAPMWRRA